MVTTLERTEGKKVFWGNKALNVMAKRQQNGNVIARQEVIFAVIAMWLNCYATTIMCRSHLKQD